MESAQKEILNKTDLLTLKEASDWASDYLNKKVSISNISYLVQYGKIQKYNGGNSVYVSKKELKNYYKSYNGKRELHWKKKLGEDLNWALSFDNYREKDTTKHVHRLHPYKGKFIPQLVEYFLDNHTDSFKQQSFFKQGDIILDPFCGSGTTMVQANELEMHCIGIDISSFNALVANSKVANYDLIELKKSIDNISRELNKSSLKVRIPDFEKDLLEELYEFNSEYFPAPDFRYKAQRNEINEIEFGIRKAQEFLLIYRLLVKKYRIKLECDDDGTFIDKWFLPSTQREIELAFTMVRKIKDPDVKRVLSILLSRTIRSCRATTHSDLATLKEPQLTSYYCVKHKKICKPLFSIRNKWITYGKDTLRRLSEFDKIRTDTKQLCLSGDSRDINLFELLKKKHGDFARLIEKNNIKGIFTSPPYVGLIDYHKQHEYAYDLFGFGRNDDLEIGPLLKGSGKAARDLYVKGISDVFNNCRKFLSRDYNVFIVANDKYDLYPTIAKNAGMKIINRYKRPVLNRTERDKSAYSESIFHLKANN